MLKRKAYSRLLEWMEKGTKPLVVHGQRQVGKTFLINAFARDNFGTVIYSDLSKDGDFRAIFDSSNSSVDDMILGMKTIRGIDTVDSGDTLIFLDEIQDCGNALSALKTFKEDGRFKVIASGSLLGVKIKTGTKTNSSGVPPLTPMGCTEEMEMHSLDFEEFLWSQNIPEDAVSNMRRSVHDHTPVNSAVHSHLMSLFRVYQIVGGMPEAVCAYNSDRTTFSNVSKAYDSIITYVHSDINRYNRDSEVVKTTRCFDSIPLQLSQTNKRFYYSRVGGDEGSRKSKDIYAENLLWIRDAGYGNFVQALNQIASPLASQVKPDVFRIYLSDTGMLTHMYGRCSIAAIYKGDSGFNMGAVTENAVAEAFRKSGYTPYFYQNKNGANRMEIDFVVEFINGPVAVEVKSGKDRDSPSIRNIDKCFKTHLKVMLEDGNIRTDDDGVLHLPLYASAFFDELEDVPPYLR